MAAILNGKAKPDNILIPHLLYLDGVYRLNAGFHRLLRTEHLRCYIKAHPRLHRASRNGPHPPTERNNPIVADHDRDVVIPPRQ